MRARAAEAAAERESSGHPSSRSRSAMSASHWSKPEGNVVRISVREDGNGVPIGLGLWIVKLLADARGGHVSYQGVDPGAEFTIQLPATPTK